jgi:hypothetical protein
MPETPANRQFNVERVVAELRARVTEERAAGAYADDLSGVELETRHSDGRGQSGLADRFDLGTGHPPIRFRPELGFSSKPVIGPVITLVKRFFLRLLFFVFDDLARQTDAAVTRLEAALAAEAAARESAEQDLKDLGQRHEDLAARLARLEQRRSQAGD